MPLGIVYFTRASTVLRFSFGQWLALQAKRRMVSTNRRTAVESRWYAGWRIAEAGGIAGE